MGGPNRPPGRLIVLEGVQCSRLPCSPSPSDLADDLSTRYEPSPVFSCPVEVSCTWTESSLEKPLLSAAPSDELAVYRSALLVVFPAFAAYACLFSLQHEVKVVYGIADDDSSASHDFSFATSMLFAFKLVFRFLHSVLFACLEPRGRLFVSMGILSAAMGLLAAVTSGLLAPLNSYIFLAYALGGAGVGSFEGNVLSAFTCLGPQTKQYAVMGMPIGVASVTIGAFLLRYLGVPVCAIYAGMVLALAASALLLHAAIPREAMHPPGEGRQVMAHQTTVVFGLRTWRSWLPSTWTRFAAAFADMAILEMFCPGLLLFVYDKPLLALLHPPAWPQTVRVPKDLFFVLYNLFTAIGSVTGRCAAYRMQRLVHPAWFVGLMALGASLIICSSPGHFLSPLGLIFAPLGGFIVLLGDGIVYVMVCRFIDERIPQAYSTAVLSSWLFTADLGSNVGANLIPYLRDWVTA